MCVWLFISCSHNKIDPYKHMAFDDVVYVTDFESTEHLTDGDEVNFEVLGVSEIMIVDSFFITNDYKKKKVFNILSYPDFCDLNTYIFKGNGHNELSRLCPLTESQVYKNEKNESIITLQTERNVYEVNINQSVAEQKVNLKEIKEKSLNLVFYDVKINDNTYFIKEFAENEKNQQIRRLEIDGKDTIPSHFNQLNIAGIDKDKDFNHLATLLVYNKHNDKIVETSVFLNNINVYNIDGSFCRTICLGEKLDDYTVKQNSRIEVLNPYMKCYDDFFCMLVKDNEQSDDEFEINKILVFDYECNPITQITFNKLITKFEFDIKNKLLYAFNRDDEYLFKYSLSFL